MRRYVLFAWAISETVRVDGEDRCILTFRYDSSTHATLEDAIADFQDWCVETGQLWNLDREKLLALHSDAAEAFASAKVHSPAPGDEFGGVTWTWSVDDGIGACARVVELRLEPEAQGQPA